jgi:hypothetical protein
VSRSSVARAQDLIRAAFAAVVHPGDDRLVDGQADWGPGTEPARVAAAFRGQPDWRALAVDFLDGAPDGLGSALSFFGDDAFRCYLPAYLLADLDGVLQQADPVFHLTHGLDDHGRGELVSPQRHGEWTWFEQRQRRFAGFTPAQAAAIVAYLEVVAARSPCDRPAIAQALASYWAARASGVGPAG